MRVIAIIPARGGSKRLPKKNIYPIWGEPMLCWAIKACKDSTYNIEPWVSTDDDEITAISIAHGARVHRRSAGLGADHIYKQVVVREAARHIKSEFEDLNETLPKLWISLQPNSPEIRHFDLDRGIDILLEKKRSEIISVDADLMQNAAFRIFDGDYVFQEDLSTNCGVVLCNIADVHSLEDVKKLERKGERKK